MTGQADDLSVICLHERQLHSVNGHSISEVAYSRFGSDAVGQPENLNGSKPA